MDSKIFKAMGYTTNFLQSIFLLAVRVYWGFLFFNAGLMKFANMSSVIPFFEQIGLAPIVAYLVALGELVCGILIFFGFLGRIAAAITAFIMLGAYVTAHPESFFSFFSYPPAFFTAPAFSFLMASLIVLFFGSGYFAIDALIKYRIMKRMENNEHHEDHHEDDHHDDQQK